MGVDRVISVLNLLNMKVKKINIKDKKNILKWRNHESILKTSFSKKITIAEHHKWFNNLLNNKNYLGLIYDNGFKKLAVVIFKLVDNSAYISIYLVPNEPLNYGIGDRVLTNSEKILTSNYRGVYKILAFVKKNNIKSKKFFMRNKFYYDNKKNIYTKNLNEKN